MNIFLKITLIMVVLNLTACNTSTNSTHFVIKDEPFFNSAWHFAHNEKFAQDNDIDKEAHVDIEEAWEITRGSGVVVAVIDSGSFEVSHEDLKENIIDTYNSDYKNKNVSVKYDDPRIDGHGLAVAGFVASPANGKGLVGAAPEAKLILIQVGDSDGSTIDAFEYAKNSGAKVISCSWGTQNVSPLVEDYLQELKDYGITIIFASGNERKSLDTYGLFDESELDSVIGVGASNEFNEIAVYSNYGKNIDLIAPGGNNERNKGILALYENGSYAFTGGTSLAAPITAGVVALMLSVNSSLTPEQVREILIQSADKIEIDSNANYNSYGFDKYRAYGKVNASKAVKLARDY